MATIKKKFIGDKQFGGFTPYGNLTTLRATLQTTAAGVVIDGDSTAALAIGDVVVLEKLDGDRYEYEGEQVDLSVREETIRVAGEDSRPLRIRETRKVRTASCSRSYRSRSSRSRSCGTRIPRSRWSSRSRLPTSGTRPR